MALLLIVAAAALPLAAGCGGPGTGGVGGNADSLTIRYEFHHNYFGVKPPGEAADEAAEAVDLTELADLNGDGEADPVPPVTFMFVVNKKGEQTDGGWLQGATLPNPSPLPSAAKKPAPTPTTQPSPP